MSASDRPGPRPLVLVPGACLGGWAWAAVARLLRARGHDVYPVTLTGLGERVHLARPETDLETHIADVVNLLDYEDLHDAVLVGHSYSGVVVTGAADRRFERLSAVVYLDCSPLPDGMSLVDVQPPEMREAQQQEVAEHGDGWRWPLPDRATLQTGAFGSTAGLSDEQLELIGRRGTAQPYATFTTPLRLTHDRPPGIRRVVTFCTAGGIDVALLQHMLEQGDRRALMFAAPDWEFHELATGHWPMFSMPEITAELLGEIADGAPPDLDAPSVPLDPGDELI
jgi:pimeloyl-ACP methyl ester carboxylesterase